MGCGGSSLGGVGEYYEDILGAYVMGDLSPLKSNSELLTSIANGLDREVDVLQKITPEAAATVASLQWYGDGTWKASKGAPPSGSFGKARTPLEWIAFLDASTSSAIVASSKIIRALIDAYPEAAKKVAGSGYPYTSRDVSPVVQGHIEAAAEAEDWAALSEGEKQAREAAKMSRVVGVELVDRIKERKPVESILTMITPSSAKMRSGAESILPLHLAARLYYAQEGQAAAKGQAMIVHALIAAYPEALQIRDAYGNRPLETYQKADSRNAAMIKGVLEAATAGQPLPPLQAEDQATIAEAATFAKEAEQAAIDKAINAYHQASQHRILDHALIRSLRTVETNITDEMIMQRITPFACQGRSFGTANMPLHNAAAKGASVQICMAVLEAWPPATVARNEMGWTPDQVAGGYEIRCPREGIDPKTAGYEGFASTYKIKEAIKAVQEALQSEQNQKV